VRRLLASTAAKGNLFPTAVDLAAAAPLVSYFLNVSNTGKVDSDDVVLGFLVPPGAGENGVPLQTLFGFERVHVPAGKTVVVNLYPSLTDFTHTLLDGTKQPAAGEWTVKFGVQETAEHGQGYAELKLHTE
jgi:pre-mRNA-splicing factor SYF2/beta-D-xylosidase 4